jgi:hypothetical protein
MEASKNLGDPDIRLTTRGESFNWAALELSEVSPEALYGFSFNIEECPAIW